MEYYEDRKWCKECERDIDKNATECPYCGSKDLERAVVCPYCGDVVGESEIINGKCWLCREG